MTPDERFDLDLFAIRYGMDSQDVDEALEMVGATMPRSVWGAQPWLPIQ
jgi:hypothetical protein